MLPQALENLRQAQTDFWNAHSELWRAVDSGDAERIDAARQGLDRSRLAQTKAQREYNHAEQVQLRRDLAASFPRIFNTAVDDVLDDALNGRR